MPIIPLPKGPSATLEPLPAVRVDPSAPRETFGGGLAARGIDASGVADVFQQIAADEKRKADQVATTDMGSDLSAVETSLATSVRQRRGQDAFSAPDEVHDQWQQAVGEIGKKAKNKTQQVAFQEMVASHWRELNQTVQTHVADQRQVYDGQVTDAYVQNERNAAIATEDPNRIALAIANQRAAVTDHLQRLYHGQAPPEILEQATAAVTSETHVDVLTKLLDSVRPGDHETAQRYFNAHQQEIAASKVGEIERMLAQRSVEGEAQQQGDRILETAIDPEAARKAAALIQEPNVRKATEERIRQAFADQERDLTQRRAQAFAQASKTIEDTGGNYGAVPISLRDQLTPVENRQLQDRADQIRHPKVLTNTSTKASLLNLAGLHPEQFMGLDLTQYKDQFSPSDYSAMLNKQLSMRTSENRAATAAEKKAAAAKANEDAARKMLESAGIHIPPTVPGAPIARPPQPGQPARPAVHPSIDALTIPQSWKDASAADSAYADYLKHHAKPDDENEPEGED